MRIVLIIVFAGVLVISSLAQLPEIDSNELLEMMASFSEPLSDRPFVPPLPHSAIEYGMRPAHDPVANLIGDIESNKVQLKFAGEAGEDGDEGKAGAALQCAPGVGDVLYHRLTKTFVPPN